VATTSPAIDRKGGQNATPPVGTVLADRYRLEAPCAGASGRFEATDRATGVRVFVKTGRQDGRLAREAELLATLDHPGIAHLVDVGSGGRPFLVLEWVEGADLGAWLARREAQLTDGQLIQILGRLADAAAAIHAAGWLHRDLKPSNVMVRPDGTPVIVDLGAALPLDERAGAESELTDGYAAPEQYLIDQREGPWTDVYGLGAIAYRALYGRPPVPAPGRLRGEAMPLAMERAGKHAEALCRAIDWALALDVAARPQTVQDWSAALRIAADDVEGALTDRAGRSVDEVSAPRTVAPAPFPLDDYPPTVRVRRAPPPKRARSAAGAPAAPAARSTRRRAGVVVAAVLLLAALGAGVAGAAWYGRPLYERYLKTAWVVDPAGGADARSIADAIARAGAGATIAIRPGTYAESLTIERPVHLVPAVPESPPLIAPSEGACAAATSDGGSISGLRFAGAKPDEPGAVPAPCLLVAHSSVRIEGNQIIGGAGPAILVRDGAAAVITGNTIENGSGPGIVVTGGAAARIAQNKFAKISRSALIVRGGAAPEVAENTFEASGGLVFAEGAAGIVERNRIASSTTSGIEVATGADPTVIDNTIEGAGGAGVFVYDHGKGRFERNQILGSRLSGIVIAAGGDARLTGNAVRESAEHGVLVVEGGRAVIEDNEVAGNQGNGIVVGWEGEAELEGNELAGNADPQLLDARAP
jgi:putative cofactor-binding repeat protein